VDGLGGVAGFCATLPPWSRRGVSSVGSSSAPTRSPRALTRHQLEGGSYRRVLHNVYATPDLDYDHALKARAAALLMPPEAAIGGRSAASWFGAPFSTVTDPVLVVVPRGCPWVGPRGVRVHRTDVRLHEVWAPDDGPRLTRATRTAWEIATLEPTLTAVALLDGMLRDARRRPGGLVESDLVSEFERRRGRWGSRRAQALLALVDGRAMSPPESKVRAACHLAGLPHPVPQFNVYERGVFLGQVDLAWPEARVVVEYEGAYHFEGAKIIEDDARYEALLRAGWQVIRLSSADLADLEAVVARIRAALDDAVG